MKSGKNDARPAFHSTFEQKRADRPSSKGHNSPRQPNKKASLQGSHVPHTEVGYSNKQGQLPIGYRTGQNVTDPAEKANPGNQSLWWPWAHTNPWHQFLPVINKQELLPLETPIWHVDTAENRS